MRPSYDDDDDDDDDDDGGGEFEETRTWLSSDVNYRVIA